MNQKKKVLITLPSLQDPGGVAAFYKSLLPHLSNAYEFSTLEIGSTNSRSKGLYLLSDQLRFRRSMANDEPDLVHINPSLDLKSFIRDGLLVKQAKQKRLPVIVFFHGWRKDFEKVVTKRLIWIFIQTFGQADCFIVLATEFKKALQQWGVKQPIHLVTTAIEESLITNFSIFHKLKQVKNTLEIKILFLSRLKREKGVFETVKAVAMLIQRGLPVSLSIAGDGPVFQELRNYVKGLGISGKKICFLGYVEKDDKFNLLADHHIYCLPSHSEGLPISVLEAMAFGLPVITRPVGGLADMFKDGEMGFLCHGKTPIEIADAIEKIVTNKHLMLKMSEYNHTFAKENFMGSIVAKKLTDIYSTIFCATKFEEQNL